MSIPALKTAKDLKEIGKKLGREELAKRVLFCVDKMMKDAHYQGVIEFAGRMKAIVQACNADNYWSEKAWNGFYKEVEDLRTLSISKENRYYGYHGRIK
jgi:hypothetical protein